eukprot:gb/GFBE01008426.1/.p1 GENE.gb/GFBE01008426.1/~~gb/GFBE01008426.1/.p1  ORF type:complete len:244 (+),score=33.48 gb/GFBE01008426.1/:1-732(+)
MLAVKRGKVNNMELYGFDHTDGVLTSSRRCGTDKNRNWCLGARGADHFLIMIEVLEASLSNAKLGVGFVFAEHNMSEIAGQSRIPGTVCRIMPGSQEVKCGGDDCEVIKCEKLKSQSAKKVALEFVTIEDGTSRIFFRADNTSPVEMTSWFPCTSGRFKPCISVAAPRVKFKCDIVCLNAGEQLSAGLCASTLGHAMWESRRYTDMTVKTSDGDVIRCHRAVLAEGSPVCAAEWRDGLTARQN